MSDADVNAKLNSIVSLLKAVGVDGGKGGKTLDDDQIQAIIRKLQNAQAEAPQIIAALEAHANRQPAEPPPPQPQYEEDEEDDDEDDDDANYPMVGPGCSDDCSVVSDLTTPTVVSCLNVPDEEHYKDSLPPMLVGSMLIAPTKRKNLVNNSRSNVRKNAVGTAAGGGAGGAAAQRRKHHNATMEKLKTDKVQVTAPAPPNKPSRSPPAVAPQFQQARPPSPKPIKSKDKATRRASLGAADATNAFASSWNAFESMPTKRDGPSTLIDDDGFLMTSGGGFEAFNPFQDATFAKPVMSAPSTPSSTKKKSSSTSSSKTKKSSSTSKANQQSSTSNNSGGSKPQPPQAQATPQRRARRASLAM